MKRQFYPPLSKLRNLMALLIALLILTSVDAQTTTITTDPINWNQSTVEGDLIIEGFFITTLSYMGDGLGLT